MIDAIRKSLIGIIVGMGTICSLTACVPEPFSQLLDSFGSSSLIGDTGSSSSVPKSFPADSEYEWVSQPQYFRRIDLPNDRMVTVSGNTIDFWRGAGVELKGKKSDFPYCKYYFELGFTDDNPDAKEVTISSINLTESDQSATVCTGTTSQKGFVPHADDPRLHPGQAVKFSNNTVCYYDPNALRCYNSAGQGFYTNFKRIYRINW